jgi:lipooligosaccharide transport system permease protein
MATPLAVRSFRYWLAHYARTWRGSVVSSFLNPTLFLAAMGLGLGTLVDRRGPSSLGGADYLVFLAPGLLIATAFQTGAQEATYPVMAALKWTRTYEAMVATPLRLADVISGHLAFIGLRVVITATVFLAVMTAFGATGSWWALATVPAALLVGLAAAAPVMAFAAHARTDNAFAPLTRFVILPMFLFSGTFFPVSQLPVGLRALAYVTPLWHGVDLARSLALGHPPGARALGHLAYLVLWAVAGTMLARAAFARRLAP